MSLHSLKDFGDCADMIRATQGYLLVECQVKGTNSTILLDRKTLSPIFKSPVSVATGPLGASFEATQIAILEHNVPQGAGKPGQPVL